MPGPVSDSSKGPGSNTPYVPSWCYDDEGGPLVCRCGCHEGWHNDAGDCLQRNACGCRGATFSGTRLAPIEGFKPLGGANG